MVSAKRRTLMEAGLISVVRDEPDRMHAGYTNVAYHVFSGYLHGRRKHNLSASDPGRSTKARRRAKGGGSGGRGGRH